MDLISMSNRERFAMMRKRHAFLSETVKGYTSLKDYARDKDEWFAILGIELSLRESCISLWIQLDYGEYEQYFVVPTSDGKLAVSHIIWWQNDVCANEVLDIFKEGIADEEDINNAY